MEVSLPPLEEVLYYPLEKPQVELYLHHQEGGQVGEVEKSSSDPLEGAQVEEQGRVILNRTGMWWDWSNHKTSEHSCAYGSSPLAAPCPKGC